MARPDEDGVRAAPERLGAAHRRADAEAPRPVVRGGDDSTAVGIASDDEGHGRELGALELLDGGVEGVQVEMGDDAVGARHSAERIGTVSHDTDKLIRQLSLVAFLMAERRALTARDIKRRVEGYSEMSDEAFARRFYSDRSELLGLGVPLQSQRDEFTGEELYTLLSEQYFLPAARAQRRRARGASDRAVPARGPVRVRRAAAARAAEPRARPRRPARGAPESAMRVDLRDPDYSPEMAGRLTKLEAAISKQRTIKFEYWTISRDAVSGERSTPTRCSRTRLWYVVGRDLERRDVRTFRVSRIRGDIRFATRRERDFRVPTDFDPAEFRAPPDWQFGEIVGDAELELVPDTAWWVERHGR